LKQLRVLLFFFPALLLAQHESNIIATLDVDQDLFDIEQTIVIQNTSNRSWDRVVLMDWANSFSNQTTALANRFAEDFKNKFQFSNDQDRGRSILPVASMAGLTIQQIAGKQDVVEILLQEPLQPGESQTIELRYQVLIPENDFTDYGRTSTGDYDLKFWYLHPAVFKDGAWQYYSHKDLNDFYGATMDFELSLHLPTSHYATSNLTTQIFAPTDQRNSYLFSGKNYKEVILHIDQEPETFKTFYTATKLPIVTDVPEDDLQDEMKLVILNKISKYLESSLGAYPHEQLLISNRYYKESPVYGLSSLPDFINPFPDGFTYEIRMLKAMTRKWVETGVNINPRDEYWLQQAITIYLMMEYQQENYPDLKIGGKFSNIWGLRSFNAAKLDFNEQYPLLFLNSARLNLDQALTTPADSLVKYNQELGSPYKAGVGFLYLQDYLKDNSLRQSIKQFYEQDQVQPLDAQIFRKILNSNTDKSVDWFFDDFITSHRRMDWKIKRVRKSQDSIRVTLKNKSGRKLPVPIYTLDGDSIISQEYLPVFQGDTIVTLSRKRANRVVLNYERIIPEFSQRDNYRTLKGFPSLSRPIRLKLLKDVENPTKSEVFVIPDIGYNLYDGVTLGPRFYNGNLLPKPFRYSIKPTYGFTSGKLVGSIGLGYSHPLEDRDSRLYQVRYGIGANTYSYEDDLMYRRVSGFLNLSYRPKDLRSNLVQQLRFRNILVNRDRDPSSPVDEPDYNVFSIEWRHKDPNFKRFFSYNIGTEISEKFGKIDARLEWRKLFKDNRQLNVRVYAGSFLYNETRDSNFFSFALDRPTDYLFDYNYYGRSEDDGLFSQQLIVAEGGFKSQLDPAFADEWITTANTSYSIWKYIFAYGDVGLVKNRLDNPKFVYDSGIRLNLLQDYFELYFPVYSNNGWEIAQQDYDQKIRFIVTLDINTFIGLFNRRWY
jgi:hypothetical protein